MNVLKQNKGVVIIYALFLLIIIAMILPVASQLIQTSYKQTSKRLTSLAQAENVARAGLIDAISWFRRQDVQPVKSNLNPGYTYADEAFNPRFSTDTAKSDTMSLAEEAIGIVQEYPLTESGNTWARYEIRRQGDPGVVAYDPHAVHDVSGQRLKDCTDGDGIVWYIECIGYVYRRRDAAVAFNVAPNEVVDKSRVATEISRLTLQAANAAVIVNDGVTVIAHATGRIIGGTTGIGVGSISGSAPTLDGGLITGTPANQTLLDTPSCESVFGVSQRELKIMSDIAVNDVASLPPTLPSMGLIYINGDATFDATNRLKGGGVLFVDGNLTLEGTSNSLFGGLIYVTGTAFIHGPALISGTLIAENGMEIWGDGDVAQVEFDSSIINSVRQELVNYRTTKAAYRIFSISK